MARDAGGPVTALEGAALALGAWVCGVIVGVVLALHIYERAQRFARTGSSRPPVHVEPGHKITSPSPEASANRRISEDAIENGASQIMAAMKDAGQPIDPQRARQQARELLQQADPLGGAR